MATSKSACMSICTPSRAANTPTAQRQGAARFAQFWICNCRALAEDRPIGPRTDAAGKPVSS
eukprot:15468644-Alexandrium_andersonii.AAC.1